MFTHNLTCNGHISWVIRDRNLIELWEYNTVSPRNQPNPEDLVLMKAEDVKSGSIGLGSYYRELHNVPEMVHCFLDTGSIWW